MNFDLNIDNYKKDELIKIFDLSQNYDKSILEAKERIIKENINNNKEITKEIKIKTINFITQAKIILLNDNNSNNNNNDNNNNETKDFQETVKEFYNSSYDLKPVTLEDPSQHMVQNTAQKPILIFLSK